MQHLSDVMWSKSWPMSVKNRESVSTSTIHTWIGLVLITIRWVNTGTIPVVPNMASGKTIGTSWTISWQSCWLTMVRSVLFGLMAGGTNLLMNVGNSINNINWSMVCNRVAWLETITTKNLLPERISKCLSVTCRVRTPLAFHLTRRSVICLWRLARPWMVCGAIRSMTRITNRPKNWFSILFRLPAIMPTCCWISARNPMVNCQHWLLNVSKRWVSGWRFMAKQSMVRVVVSFRSVHGA